MKPELLLPAGDLEKLKIAFQYGADAVYSGVPMMSLRARENTFTIETVREAVEYTRSIGKKIYLTINIFPHNRKIPLLERALKKIADLKPDGFIVADPGVIMICKETAPKIPLHLSVQANNVNWASAKFWHQQGVERIILSREINLEEVREIHEKNPGLELEFFVHGSICMAYSGRCLLSSYMAHRDSNQGVCAHSCRWKYKVYLEEEKRPGELMIAEEDEHGSYIMNSRDLCLIEYLKDLKDAGICSFKVEGRNKTAYYVATVAKTYRQAIEDMEAGKAFNPELLKELSKTSNRGFIGGFLSRENETTAQDYERNATYQTHEFVGVITGMSEASGKRLYEMEVKGRLDAPTNCEILTPDAVFPTTLLEFQDQQHRSHLVVHPGQKDRVWIELPRAVPIGSFLRKEREKFPKL